MKLRRLTILFPVVLGLVLVSPSAQADPGFYGTPLFGIAASGDRLLVADSARGIVDADTGALVAALPAVTDVAPSARGGLWATTGGFAGPWKLWHVSGSTVTEVADLGAFERRHNPHPALVESNPQSVADLGGGRAVVADAAGNSVLLVREHNPRADVSSNVKVVATLPDDGSLESVPTSVTVGPDGAYYVGELRGFPGPVGESRIWRIEPNARNARCGESPKCRVVVDGLTSIMDLAFGPDGRLYAAQLDDNGWFAMEIGLGAGGSVHACTLATGACSEVVSDIFMLTAIAFRGGELWGATNALIPGLADVVELG